MDIVTKFYQALNKLDIKYDEETGRLSKPINFVVYDAHRKVSAKRLFIFKNYFLILREEENDTRKIQFKHIKGFQYADKGDIFL
ncbi:hypothetical protein QRD89_18510 [Halobacillus sp. ACCC02827]|uniref:hypothetical protein n=1 Tax=Bacillaceae TaxID=186817 RepID=UPI0002A4E15B|nr:MULTISPECIES: hypothetical protein [Bacillaceae]ELK44199.1 hypothetical protein D479_20098 [Halobacillus sp. BAB-2008]QHT48453.1 hypothetical protein M662_18830 [Bacillus sp. SB49]WJE15689.1 hypothetical protein QRD89_18510 [Halobacillus sp. ACCC02827]